MCAPNQFERSRKFCYRGLTRHLNTDEQNVRSLCLSKHANPVAQRNVEPQRFIKRTNPCRPVGISANIQSKDQAALLARMLQREQLVSL